jgi:glycine cleavage system transcriptional repressor
MANRYIMTAFGKDRPGIVADVTRLLYENGCNLEDNSMTLLADEFTLILLFSCTDTAIEERLLQDCRRLEKDKGISAFIRPLKERQDVASGRSIPCVLHVEGLDQSGIVYKISQYLADSRVNIIDLNSKVKSSPESGTALYLMDIDVRVPHDVPLEQVEAGLGAVADDLHVDITLSRI